MMNLLNSSVFIKNISEVFVKKIYMYTPRVDRFSKKQKNVSQFSLTGLEKANIQRCFKLCSHTAVP